jgi:putative restriction endonuclease
VIRQLTNRKFREVAFQRVIRLAYDTTCAMTGIRMINGGGHCEVQAAHIRSVENHGPDSPRNGVALSQTIHWAFDRGLLSLEDDGKILLARKLVPDPVKQILNPDGYIRMPRSAVWRPHPQFLRFHREHMFKG